MTVGKDVSGLFPDILVNMVSSTVRSNQVGCQGFLGGERFGL